jgi:hypothetical protein
MCEFLPLSCRADAVKLLPENSDAFTAFEDDGDLTLHWPQKRVFCTVLAQPAWTHRYRIHVVRRNSDDLWEEPVLFKATEFEAAKAALLHALGAPLMRVIDS